MSEFADETPQFEQAAEPAPEQVSDQANILVSDPGPDPQPTQLAAQVKGRIDIEDEVVEKVAGLAATEVEGVADLGGDVARTVESVRERVGIGHRRGDQGVKAHIDGREVSIEVTIVIEYGHVVMEVARNVQTNVAIQANRMLGLRVVEVNVIVDDVRMPTAAKPAEPADDERLTIGN
jgi:uncharacterized alkaline shock family protein YloU